MFCLGRNLPTQTSNLAICLGICRMLTWITMVETEIILHNWNIIVNCYYLNTKEYWKLKPPSLSLHKKWSFPLRFFPVNVIKPAFTGEILNGKKTPFFVQCIWKQKNIGNWKLIIWKQKSIGNCTKIVVNLRQFTLRETCPNTELFLFRIFLSLD